MIHKAIQAGKLIPILVSTKQGKELQQLAFTFGFAWKNGSRVYRNPSAENNYVLRFDFKRGTFDFVPTMFSEIHFPLGFRTTKEIEYKILKRGEPVQTGIKTVTDKTASENAESALDKLTGLFEEYRKEIPPQREKPAKLTPNPKFPPIVRKRYQREKVKVADLFAMIPEMK